MKKMLSLIVSIMLVCGIVLSLTFQAGAVNSKGQCGDNITYTFDYVTGLVVISGTGEMCAHIYPKYSPFYEADDIKAVIVEEGVTSICGQAFYGCENLSSISLPSTIEKIGVNAFTNTAYYKDEMNWESGVLYIGNHLIKAKTDLFSECYIKDGTITIANMAFDNCTNLTSVILPDSVENIGEQAFDRCSSLFELQMSKNIKRIDSCAFHMCSKLAEIWLPDHVIEIGYAAFSDTKYARNSTNWEHGSLYKGGALYIGKHLVDFDIDSDICVVKDGTIDIANATFEDCNFLRVLSIPVSVKHIGAYLTYYCFDLEKIYFAGTEEQWNSIVAQPNDDLTSHTIVFGQAYEHDCYDNNGDGVCDVCHREISAEKEYLPGDISGDDKVNMGDVAKLYAHIKGTSVLTNETGLDRCDISGDGKVNMGDVAKLYAHIKGTNKLY